MLTRNIIVAAAALLTTAAAMPAAAVELIVNGGFENTGFGGTGTYYNLGGNGADHGVPADFGFSVPVNNVDIIANGVYTPYLATGGAYNLDLVGYGSTGAISQTFDTVLGKTYVVKVDYNENGSGKVADVSINGGSIATLTGSSTWQTSKSTFIGTGSPVTFAITETVGGNSGGVVLDNVSVAVPEPASWVMMIAGFGLVGFAARRRAAALAA
jgi:hypothetical protein